MNFLHFSFLQQIKWACFALGLLPASPVLAASSPAGSALRLGARRAARGGGRGRAARVVLPPPPLPRRPPRRSITERAAAAGDSFVMVERRDITRRGASLTHLGVERCRVAERASRVVVGAEGEEKLRAALGRGEVREEVAHERLGWWKAEERSRE